VRAALDWAAHHDLILGLELASALEAFWGPHAPAEGVRRIRDLLARAQDVPPALQALALRNLAGAAHQERDFQVAEPCYEESLRIFLELGDRRGAASIRTRLAFIAYTRGDFETADRLLNESDREAAGHFPLIESQNTILRTHLALESDRIDEATAAAGRAAGLVKRVGWRWFEAIVQTLLVEVAMRRGDLEEAERHGRAALSINLEQEHAPPTTAQTMVAVARVALERADLERAGLLWGAVSRQGTPLGRQGARLAERLAGETRPAFTAAVERGQALELWDAVAIALGELELPQTEP
jgi:tetratricopeptide (TPR) repeat protein